MELRRKGVANARYQGRSGHRRCLGTDGASDRLGEVLLVKRGYQMGRHQDVCIARSFFLENVATEIYVELLGSRVTKKSRPIDSIAKGAPVADSRL